MWKKLMTFMMKKQKNTAAPAKQLRPVEQYFQLSLPLE